MEENKLICENCGCVIDTDDYSEVNGQVICYDCIESETTLCDCCGTRIFNDDVYGDDYTTLCPYCYNNHYTRCCCCDALLYEDDAYHLDDEDYCRECYNDECDKFEYIHEYGYKPEPKFYGCSERYFGIELKIDNLKKSL